jgi:hypothetical protein
MNTVYTYFETVPELEPHEQYRQIEVWATSWRRHGWKPLILNRATAAALGSSEVDAWEKQLTDLPSTNHRAYTRATYMRWFALSAMGGGLMTDYDVVNVGFAPEDMQVLVQAEDCVCLCPQWVPAVVWTNAAGCERLIDVLLTHKMTDLDQFDGKPHTSDMFIFQQAMPGAMKVKAREWQEPDQGEPLIHCANYRLVVAGVTAPRSQVMRETMEAGGKRNV